MLFGRWSTTRFLAFCGICVFILITGTDAVKHRTNIILVGATGDLSRKYLWQAIFTLYLDKTTQDHSFGVFGAGRASESNGRPIIDKYLETRLFCVSHSESECSKHKESFSKLVTYVQLKKDGDYDSLSTLIRLSTTSAKGELVKETGRIFYLSVPPFAYESIATSIRERCMPPPNAWLRVVLEKPFGHDTPSAIALSNGLSKNLKEEEMYRIDHYLGKIGVKLISQFRFLNRDTYESIWNNQYIERVEIVMKETLDCAGRTKFYDNYGAIRDVLQNHLTEILVLIAMDLPQSDDSSPLSLTALKTKLLNEIIIPSYGQVVVRGQYSGYSEHVRSDTPEKTNTSVETFASVLLNVKNDRWRGVPFLLSTGKKLDERRAYVRVLFKKHGIFCVEAGECEPVLTELLHKKEIVFNIQGGKIGVPAISITSNLPVAKMPSSIKHGRFIGYDEPAYTALLRDVFDGDLSQFVGTEGLFASWRIWDLVRFRANAVAPCIYESPTNGILDVSIGNHGVQYIKNLPEHADDSTECSSNENILPESDSKLLGHPIFTGNPLRVAYRLSHDIHRAAQTAIASRGVFHLAVSGGRSPIKLFQALASLENFPWEFVHVWLVDERCVPFNSDKSNYRMISRELISHIPIIHNNIHPMPVHGERGLCQEDDILVSSHADSLSGIGYLDFVVLGLGSDGHTASLFPGSVALQESSKWVVLSDAPQYMAIQQRMTLTYFALSKAQDVAILVLGSSKKDILAQLLQVKDIELSKDQYPILGVLNNANQNAAQKIKWYIDKTSLPGTG